jgi:2-oxoglutarate ferredoxin oxidoreductase subunit gamma
LQTAIEQQAPMALKRWQAAHKALTERPALPPRSDHVPRTEVQLGGFGGQGIMSAGKIIGQAAALFDKFEACFTQSYGPEARGGAAGSQVVIASDPIHHPHLIEPGSAIIMSQAAYDKYVPSLAVGACLLIDDTLVTLPRDHRPDVVVFGLPATTIAADIGNARAANSVMLGFWTAVMDVVRPEAMRQSLAGSVPSKTLEANLKAFAVGFDKGRNARHAKTAQP